MKAYAVHLRGFNFASIVAAETPKAAAYHVIKAARSAGYNVELTEPRTVHRAPDFDSKAEGWRLPMTLADFELKRDETLAIDWKVARPLSFDAEAKAKATTNLKPFIVASGLLPTGWLTSGNIMPKTEIATPAPPPPYMVADEYSVMSEEDFERLKPTMDRILDKSLTLPPLRIDSPQTPDEALAETMTLSGASEVQSLSIYPEDDEDSLDDLSGCDVLAKVTAIALLVMALATIVAIVRGLGLL